MARVKERGRDRKKGRKLPSFLFPSIIFWLSFHFSRIQKRKPRFSSLIDLSLLRNRTEALATQANNVAFQSNRNFQLSPWLTLPIHVITKSHIWRFTAATYVLKISACFFPPSGLRASSRSNENFIESS